MARRKDLDWRLPEGELSYEGAQLAVLMDLRDELKSLNRILHCPNFIAIPAKLDMIQQNTKKKHRKKKRG